MMKRIVLFLAMMAAALPVFGEVTLKLTGGMTYASLSDVNRVTGDTNLILRKYTTNRSGEMETSNFAAALNGEVTIAVAPQWSLGLGVGYFKVGPENHLSYTFIGGVPTTHDVKASIAVFPITLTVRRLLALSPSIDLLLGAGVGYYQTTFDFSVDYVWNAGPGSYKNGLDYSFTSSKGGIGFHIAAGLDYKLARNIRLTVEAIGRLVSVSDYSGDWKQRIWDSAASADKSGSGHSFWYFEEKIENVSYAQFYFWSTEPDGGQNIRKAKLDLSGFALTAGITYSF